jgi:hypothetical protein
MECMQNIENMKNIFCCLYIFFTEFILNSERQCFLSDTKVSVSNSFLTNSSEQLALRWRKEEEQTNRVPFYLIPTYSQHFEHNLLWYKKFGIWFLLLWSVVILVKQVAYITNSSLSECYFPFAVIQFFLLLINLNIIVHVNYDFIKGNFCLVILPGIILEHGPSIVY